MRARDPPATAPPRARTKSHCTGSTRRIQRFGTAWVPLRSNAPPLPRKRRPRFRQPPLHPPPHFRKTGLPSSRRPRPVSSCGATAHPHLAWEGRPLPSCSAGGVHLQPNRSAEVAQRTSPASRACDGHGRGQGGARQRTLTGSRCDEWCRGVGGMLAVGRSG